jgi:hypothetical protein
MVADLILQFLVLHFCFSKTGEKKPRKKRKRGKWLFNRQAKSYWSAVPGILGLLCSIK